MTLPSPPSGLPSYLRGQQPFWPTFWIAWAGVGLGGWVLAVLAARQVTRLFGNPAGDGGVREMLGGFALGGLILVLALRALWRAFRARPQPPSAWLAFGLAAIVTAAALLPLLLVLVYVSFV